MSLFISIQTPKKIFWEGDGEKVILPTSSGALCILENHARLFTGLDIGPLLVSEKGKWTSLAIIGGFALVLNNFILVFAEDAESLDTINCQEVEKSFLLTKQEFQKSLNQDDRLRRAQATLDFKINLALYRIIHFEELL